MISFNAMIFELGDETEIDCYDVFAGYGPQNLRKTAQAFDELTKEYLKEYRKVNLQAERYRNIDVFITQYLSD